MVKAKSAASPRPPSRLTKQQIAALVAAANASSPTKLTKLLDGLSPADLQCLDGERELTPLAAACLDARLPAVELLLARGADPAFPAGDTLPIDCALSCRLNASQREVDDRVAIVHKLLAAGSPVEGLGLEGKSVLFQATEMGRGKARALVRDLLARGAKADCVTSEGESLLHVAAAYEQPEAFDAGLAAGLNANGAIKQGYFKGATPLHNAAEAKSEALVRRCIAAGADPDKKDSHGRSARSLLPKSMLPLLEGKAVAARPAPRVERVASTSGEAALRAAIWAAPRDHGALSVYADWLMANGGQTRGEYMQLRLLEAPSEAQRKRANQLLAKNRGAWLGDARKALRSWEDSETSPGFVARARVGNADGMLASFDAIRALGPELVVRLPKPSSQKVAEALGALPLGSLYGLELVNDDGDWMNDKVVELLSRNLAGLRALSLEPGTMAPRRFTAASMRLLAERVGATLEDLHLGFFGYSEDGGYLSSVLGGGFPALRRLEINPVFHSKKDIAAAKKRPGLQVVLLEDD